MNRNCYYLFKLINRTFFIKIKFFNFIWAKMPFLIVYIMKGHKNNRNIY